MGLVQTAELADGPAAARGLLDEHAVCYPPQDHERFLKPLLPDRLGEDFIARLLSGRDDTSGAWCVQLVAPDGDDAPGAHAASALTVLVETARRWDSVRRDHLFPLLQRHPRLAADSGGPSLVALAEFADADVLQTLEPHLPRHRALEWRVAVILARLPTPRPGRRGGRRVEGDVQQSPTYSYDSKNVNVRLGDGAGDARGLPPAYPSIPYAPPFADTL